ncbi:12548_t:CDS:2, partial [Cetraspora pellucida]
EYIAKNYKSLKAANPHFPILIREASGVEARLFARYDFGKETKVVLDNLSAEDIESKLKDLVTKNTANPEATIFLIPSITFDPSNTTV